MSEALPAPPIAANVDLRGTPIPSDLFVRMAVDHLGVDREEARRLVDQAADRVEGARAARRGRNKSRERL